MPFLLHKNGPGLLQAFDKDNLTLFPMTQEILLTKKPTTAMTIPIISSGQEDSWWLGLLCRICFDGNAEINPPHFAQFPKFP